MSLVSKSSHRSGSTGITPADAVAAPELDEIVSLPSVVAAAAAGAAPASTAESAVTMGIGFTGTFSCDAVFACALAIDVFSWEEETSAFAVLEESAELAAVPILEASSEAVESRTFSLDGGGAAMAPWAHSWVQEKAACLAEVLVLPMVRL